MSRRCYQIGLGSVWAPILVLVMFVWSAAAAAPSVDPPALGEPDAVSQAVEAAGAEPFTAADYLSAADRLTLRFRGYPELTGDYRVSPDEMISVPVVGRVSIAGFDTAGLEKALSAKLSQITGKEAFVTVEVAAYHPVYVTGSVKNPGAIEWRPGLTVLQAITLVGGMASDLLPGTTGVPGQSSLVLRKAIDSRNRDLATLARLEAERQGQDQVNVPAELVRLTGPDEANALIAREAKTFANDRATAEVKLTTLKHGIDAGNAEMASLREQISKLNAQLDQRRDYRKKIKDLFNKGIITNERDLEEEIKVNDLEEKITNVNVGIAKSAGTVAELQLAAVGLERDREGVIDASIAKLERDLAQTELEIKAAGEPVDPVPNQAADRSSEPAKPPLQIMRQKGLGVVTIVADQSTPMRPGDVLIVRSSSTMSR